MHFEMKREDFPNVLLSIAEKGQLKELRQHMPLPF